MRFVLIAAVAANGVIGDDGTVPWHYPADLRHFRRTTVGHPVIVGRRTFDDIFERLGEPLPDRRNVVLTSRPERLPDSVVGVSSREAAAEAASNSDVQRAYIAGGASVYEQFLPCADELVLTELHEAFEGDTVFPTVEWSQWREVTRDSHAAFDIVRYVRTDGDDDSASPDISEGL